MSGPPLRCWLCGDAAAKRCVVAREMMFGMRDRFAYAVCGSCGSLQLREIPDDMARYYPPAYYAYRDAARIVRPGYLEGWLRRERARHLLGRRAPLGLLVERLKPAGHPLTDHLRWLACSGADLDARILDVGCGNGALLRELSVNGFRHLAGIDPLIATDSTTPEGIRLLRQDIFSARGTYDVVIFRHSLEHMAEPLRVLVAARALLSPGGHIAVDIPTVSSAAWEEYGPDWAQLDAPRHLFLPSVPGMDALARAAGFVVRDRIYDSTAFQFWASEQYRRDIPLYDGRSYAVDTAHRLCTAAEMRSYAARADRLNTEGRGDQLCFILTQGAA